MRKRTVTVRGVTDTVLRALHDRSEANRRSLNAELLTVLEEAANLPGDRAAPTAVREATTTPYATRPPSALPRLADRVDSAALARVCRRHHIKSLALFGSQAQGDAGPGSDVDVLVEFEPGMTPGLALETVAEALRPVLGGGRVDLVTRRGLSPRLRERILPAAVPLYGA
jgi:predicted nucleotidyltransferase